MGGDRDGRVRWWVLADTIGDSTPPAPFRPRHQWRRSAYELEHGGHEYLVDVHYYSWRESVRLYRDGELTATGRESMAHRLPDGAVIEVALSGHGTRFARLDDGGKRRDLTPVAGTAEARIARLASEDPLASRVVAVLSWTTLVAATLLLVPQIINVGHVLVFSWPPLLPSVDLPVEANLAVTIAAVAAGIERGWRPRYLSVLLP